MISSVECFIKIHTHQHTHIAHAFIMSGDLAARTPTAVCRRDPCWNNGDCGEGTICRKEWDDKSLQEIQYCVDDPCSEGGPCVTTEGERCELNWGVSRTPMAVCKRMPCWNNGKCEEGAICRIEWEEVVQQEIEYCVDDPCVQGGPCVSTEGERCEIEWGVANGIAGHAFMELIICLTGMWTGLTGRLTGILGGWLEYWGFDRN